ncbi:glutamate synthase large subunit [Temperatibacter marinus]|uniref:Glutamate synthase [NADPH] large chain n=1 Tax=Temperatibacter marinus TaxID=1456591 RepID=A0AA52EJL2_9PROT|nr:glutamate synthase large subunit [Temperatibacter marinus]WND03464.1 glutamate synthase large subunit [Temperatibacter marinus]
MTYTDFSQAPGPMGLYDPAEEKGSCGVGMIVATDGVASRKVVLKGIEALQAIWHRGAVDADGKTGDGAGIHLEIPQEFFRKHVIDTGHEPLDGKIGVGMAFMPRTDLHAQEICRTIVEREIIEFGYEIYGWRQVPVDISVIGEKAEATRPEIEQIMIANNKGLDDDEFERDLYVIRRRIEKAAVEAQVGELYICSLSCRSVIYKGLFLAEQLSSFFPDLEDDKFISSFAIYHQRYSTNTFPQWWLAQPFRMLAHNGEINTIRGNVNWMKSHQIRMASIAFGDHSSDIKPVIPNGASDSAALDAAFEVMVRAGRNAPMVKTLLVPEAWSKRADIPDAHKAMYAYTNSVMEPWDGPAALAATDGRWVIAGLDRSGLRPMRYTLTDDNLLVVGSETGMVVVDEDHAFEKGRLGPGEMVAVDLKEGRFYHDRDIKDVLCSSQPFEEWSKDIQTFEDVFGPAIEEKQGMESEGLRRHQLAAGLSHEDIELILTPQAVTGKEAIGSMGDDTPIAVLSKKYRNLSHYFRQNFSQVTNPPIDSLRESGVMSLKTRFGNFANVLDEGHTQEGALVLESPVLTNAEFEALRGNFGDSAHEIDCTFDAAGGPKVLKLAIERIRQEAEDAVREGRGHLFLSDRNISDSRAPIPMILATAGVHTHLVAKGLRTFTSVNVAAAECLDTHYFCVLLGAGATTVNAYLAQETLAERHSRGLLGDLSLNQAVANQKEAINQGILKIMAKMGISVVSSYRGGYNFEALGLSRSLVAEFFPGMPSKISGIGLSGIKAQILEQHEKAYSATAKTLPIGGLYRLRRNEEMHAYDGKLIHTLQSAVTEDNFQKYLTYSRGLRDQPPVNLRDLLEINPNGETVPLDDVESITHIRKRFITPGMSLGALSKEAHETLAIAMNRIGAKSVSGEGGEDKRRFTPYDNGDNANSPIKQIASGRFGVTAEYLNACEEIEIKVAQGAKPGEGGQLPGFKVTDMIAKLRHSTPGVTLISPPPHHDIYSIEDLAQLIYDLKQINPDAKVCVKLVSSAGIGTIAAGVAKAHADVILVSGHNGGTGASPQTSIKYAGTPWEIGLAEVNQVLTLNNLRHRVKLRVDGGFKTGRDVVIGAILGAEEFGVGTASLVAMGCIMVRQCHSNTCPVGVCTQDDELRKKFVGTADKVVNLFTFIAEEVRDILSQLGVKTLNEIVGRTELLSQVSRGAKHLDDLDLNPLLVQVSGRNAQTICSLEGRNEVPDTLDAQMVEDAKPVFTRGEKMQLNYTVRNTDRAIGTRFSSHVTRKYGMKSLTDGHVTVRLRGSAGQSLGAFLVQGVKLVVTGDANDYVGKGLSGGSIVVKLPKASGLNSRDNTIIGNTVLYGATSGTLYAAGQAGERFAVRNSGANVVVEGCGACGCEYMTGGTAIILGDVGENFGAGMTGGMAFVLDQNGTFESRVNSESVVYQRLASQYWEEDLLSGIRAHVLETGSRWGATILANWEEMRGHVWQVCPKEMLSRLSEPLSDEAPESSDVA